MKNRFSGRQTDENQEGRHLPVFQVFPDVSVSLVHKQAQPMQNYLILTQMMHQRYWT